MEEMDQKPLKQPNQEKLRRDLAVMEAGLYVAGRPLDLKTLGSLIHSRSKKKVQSLARALIKQYAERDTALEILELEDERFVLQLKAEYTPKVRKLAMRPLLSVGPLKTLSYIAYRQPVLQARVIDVRGEHAYDHLKQLEDLGLILRERSGRSTVIRTTEFFADYFGLSHDLKTMKRQLANVFEEFAKPESQKKEQNV